MKDLRNALARTLTSEKQDARLASWTSFATALLVLVTGWVMASRLTDRNEILLFLAVLAVAGVSLLFVLLGFLCTIAQRLAELRSEAEAGR